MRLERPNEGVPEEVEAAVGVGHVGAVAVVDAHRVIELGVGVLAPDHRADVAEVRRSDVPLHHRALQERRGVVAVPRLRAERDEVLPDLDVEPRRLRVVDERVLEAGLLERGLDGARLVRAGVRARGPVHRAGRRVGVAGGVGGGRRREVSRELPLPVMKELTADLHARAPEKEGGLQCGARGEGADAGAEPGDAVEVHAALRVEAEGVGAVADEEEAVVIAGERGLALPRGRRRFLRGDGRRRRFLRGDGRRRFLRGGGAADEDGRRKDGGDEHAGRTHESSKLPGLSGRPVARRG